MMEDCEVGLYSSTPPLQQITTGPKVESAASTASRTGHTAPPPSENGRSCGTSSTALFPCPCPCHNGHTGVALFPGHFRHQTLAAYNLLLHSHNSIFSPSAHVRKTYTKFMCSSTHTGSCVLHLLGKECHGYTATMRVSRLVQGPDFGQLTSELQ